MEEDIEEIIEKKVEERMEKKKQEIRKEIKQELQQENRNHKSSEDQISRRSFLKKLGAGAIGLGALSLAPAASKVTISDTGITQDGNRFWHQGELASNLAGYGLTDNSGTFDIVPSDFAGSGLQVDGNDNLELSETYVTSENLAASRMISQP